MFRCCRTSLMNFLKRGYSEKDIRKILGENFLRVFAEAERVSRGMSKSISGDGSVKRISSQIGSP